MTILFKTNQKASIKVKERPQTMISMAYESNLTSSLISNGTSVPEACSRYLYSTEGAKKENKHTHNYGVLQRREECMYHSLLLHTSGFFSFLLFSRGPLFLFSLISGYCNRQVKRTSLFCLTGCEIYHILKPAVRIACFNEGL